MIAFHSVLTEIAQREVRSVRLNVERSPLSAPGLPAGDYAYVEFYCDNLNCDCRRVFLQVIAHDQSNQVLASINYGWEDVSFYRQKMPYDPEAPAQIVHGSLDPLNTQSEHSAELLALFRSHVLDETYRLRLQRHYQQCRDELRRRQSPASPPPAAPADQPPADKPPAVSSARKDPNASIPAAHRARFEEIAALLTPFGQQHLDDELTGFTIELWRRLCRRKSPDCLRGQSGVWAASVIHVVARMNFLFDRNQPIHLTFDTICGHFGVSKTTVGGKATGIERTLRLRPHSEPGICRRKLQEQFTTVRFANGMLLPFDTAKQLGYLPPNLAPGDLA